MSGPQQDLQQLSERLLGALEEGLGLENGLDAGLKTALAAFRDGAVEVVRRYHRLQVDIEAGTLRKPVLFVANHGFGGILDLNVMATQAALEDMNLDRGCVQQSGVRVGADRSHRRVVAE